MNNENIKMSWDDFDNALENIISARKANSFYAGLRRAGKMDLKSIKEEMPKLETKTSTLPSSLRKAMLILINAAIDKVAAGQIAEENEKLGQHE